MVSFEITAFTHEQGAKGRADYLGSGEKTLPSVYYMFFLLDTAACAAWAFALGRRQSGGMIHWLMLASCAPRRSPCFRAGGSVSHHAIDWIVQRMDRGVLHLHHLSIDVAVQRHRARRHGLELFKTVFTPAREKFAHGCHSLQVMANIATIVIGQEGPADQGWFAWQNMFIVIDIICCCAVLVPVVWSIKHLRDSSDGSEKKTRNLEKLILFRHFYVMTVAYIYFTRIIVYLLRSTVEYKYRWTSAFFNETATLAYYIATGYMFRPEEQNMYFHLKQDEDEDGVEMSDRASWTTQASAGDV